MFLCSDLIVGNGVVGWVGLAAFAGYKLVVVLGVSRLQRAAARRPVPQLLLLRAFGARRRSEQLFDLLAARWRYAGNIQLIAGPDLASTALAVDVFLDFVSGRLRRNFIHNRDDLETRVNALDRRPEPDGRFRIDTFFCASDTWKQTVARLIGRVDIVLMDLRGFTKNHAGCVFELRALMGMAARERIVLLLDRTTDEPFLQATLRGIGGPLAAAPAPAARIAQAQPHVLRVDRAPAAAVRRFLNICRGIADTARKGTAARPELPVA
jgi:hypothetical protein